MQLGTVESLVTVGIVCLGAIAVGVWFWMRRSPNPEERERQRRLAVSRAGRMTDALLTDVRDTTVCYTFSARGMTYMASQDISMFLGRLPEDLMLVVGPVTVKYMWNNPANSIVICEDWSGIRIAKKGTGA